MMYFIYYRSHGAGREPGDIYLFRSALRSTLQLAAMTYRHYGREHDDGEARRLRASPASRRPVI